MAEPQAEKTNRDRLRDLLQGGMEKSSVRVATNFAPLINQLGISPESTAALLMGGDKSPLPLGMGVADFVPFLGTALGTEEGIQDLKDARQSIKNDDYLGAGVDVAFGALGLIPGMAGTAKYGRKAFKGMRNIDLSKIPALMRPPTHANLPTPAVEQGMAKGGSARSKLAELLADDGAHMAAGGRAKALVKSVLKPDAPAVNRIEMGFKDVTKRIPELTEAANLVKAGKMSAKEFEQLVNYFKPVTPYDFVPKPASRKEAMGALKENQRDLYGVPSKTLEEGYPVGGRLDISAYKDHGVWVPTVHEQTGGFGAGRVIGHESVMSLKDPSFGMHPEAALSIAAGNPKGTIATIKGDWDPVSDDEAVARAREYLRHKDWVQAGMDPERHSYFYDRRSMDPVLAGDQAYQIGPLVLVKNPKYGDKKDFKYAAGGEVHMARGGRAKATLKSAIGRGRADIRKPQTTTSITKEGGGNWLAGSVEGAMKPLKRGVDDQVTAVRNPATGAFEYLPATPDPMNQWIDKQLTRYVKNQMATKEDPIRALAEKGNIHVDPDQLNFNPFTYGKYLGAGQKVVAQSPTAKSWEGVSDLSISPMIAKQLLGNDGTWMGRGDSILEYNPWLNKVPEETSVYSMTDPQGVPSDLGFDHLIDELRNATNPASGLPRELLIKPESLSKLSVPQAVERVAKINEWRAAQKAEADVVRARNPATFLHKDYPDKGYSWQELKLPETPTGLPEGWKVEEKAGVLQARSPDGNLVLGESMPDLVKNIYLRHPDTSGSPKAALEDALKYEGETMGHCVGGYCPDVMEGRSRIYSLRDAKGQPHVTVETQPDDTPLFNKLPDELQLELHDRAHKVHPEIEGGGWPGDFGDVDYEKTIYKLMQEPKYQNILQNAPPDNQRIVQIKGKSNKKPNAEYLPFVQDFVRSGKWSDVGDFSNTGLMRIAPESNEALYLQKQNKPIPEYVSDQEYEEIRRGMADAMRSPYGAADEGMKEGGVAHMDKGDTPESPETPEQQFQHYLRMLRINATGGKDQHGTGVGGRLGLNIPVSKNISIEPYVQGFAFKPGSGKLMNGGAGGANLNIRFKNGGEVHMKKGGKAKGAIKSGLRNMLSETAAPPPGVEPIVVRPKDERELKGAMRPSVEPVRGQTSKEMRAAQREQLTPQQQEKLKALKSQYPDFAQATKFMMPGEVSKIIENPNGVKEMNALLQVIPNAKEMAAVAKTGEAKRGWYRASTQAIMNVFGDDAPRFSSLLAALSPQNSVETNLLNTLNTWKNWTAAGRPTDDRSIREVLGRSVQGTKGEESVLEAWAQNAIRSLSAQDPSKVVLSGAKVDSFWRNLADDVYRVTNDAWMANGMGVQQKLFGQKPTDLQLQRGDPGLTPGYIGASARTREAGQIANMFPSEAQETTWSTFMPLYEMQEKLGLPAREILQRGLLTPEVIRGTPDFSTLFNDPTYRRILDESGYGEQLSNLRPHQWPEARIDLNLSEQRALENTARRLEGLRSDRNKETRSRTVSLPSEGGASRAYPFETAEYIPMRGAGHAEELIDAPFGQRQAFTSKMSGAFTDFAGKDVLHGALDLKPLRATGALGSYQPPGRYPWIQLPKEVQPMFALGHESPVTASLDLPKRTHDKMRSAAALRGAMTGQGGQAYNAQIPDPNGTSLFVPLDKKVGKDEMTFSAGLVPENTFLADTGRGMSVINYGDKYGGEEAELIAQRLGGTDSVPTTSRGDYIDYSKDWQQPQGSGAVTTKMLSHMGPLSVRDFNELSKAAQVPAGEVYDAYRALESNKGYVVREDLMNMLRILRNQGIPGVAAALAAGEALPSEPEQAKRTGGLASLKYGGGRA